MRIIKREGPGKYFKAVRSLNKERAIKLIMKKERVDQAKALEIYQDWLSLPFDEIIIIQRS
jgi:hypothetical protein